MAHAGFPLPPDEKFHTAEVSHRHSIHLLTDECPTSCSVSSETCPVCKHLEIGCLDPGDIADYFTKSVPLYLVNGPRQTNYALHYVLYNWLYSGRLQPNQSDDYARVAKVLPACHPFINTTPAVLIQLINEFNKKLCDQVSYSQNHTVAQLIRPKVYTLQPLFRALAIVVMDDDFDVRITDVGKLPVILTITGEEDGLSRPLSFETIRDHVEKFISEKEVKVSLRTAIEFVIDQQKREMDAKGQQPDPVKTKRGQKYGLDQTKRRKRRYSF